MRNRKPAWRLPEQTGRNLGWARLVFQLPPSGFRFFNLVWLISVTFLEVNTLHENRCRYPFYVFKMLIISVLICFYDDCIEKVYYLEMD